MDEQILQDLLLSISEQYGIDIDELKNLVNTLLNQEQIEDKPEEDIKAEESPKYVEITEDSEEVVE